MNQRAALRNLLKTQDMLVMPGAYDCVLARLVERAGFPGVYMTGGGTSGGYGFPDYGLVTMTEMVQNASRIAGILKVPLIADADTGFGNELNVIRTVREFERVGVAGIHIEDQVFPKKCGHLAGKEVIALDDYIVKIRAAVEAKDDPDFLIIARTDCRSVLGFEEAVRRANAALDAGADMAFLEAPETLEEIMSVPKLVKGPCLLNVVRGGKSPDVDLKDVRQAGYKIAIVPTLLTFSVIGVCEQVLEELKRTDRHPRFPNDQTMAQFKTRRGFEEWDTLRKRYQRTEPGR